jgi:hypothetical protein
MSAATDTPAGVAGGDATQTTDGGDAIASSTADASAGTPSAGDASSQDYLGRIRADADFAVREVTGHQSRADKMEAEVRRLTEATGGDSGPIREILAQGIAPETVKVVFDNYLALRNNPQSQEMILGFEQTGALPERSQSSTSVDEEEYLSDEQKEIRQLRSELQALKQDQTGLTQSTGTAALQGHLERFAKENFLRPEEFETLKQGMAGQVKQWGTNDQGLGLLRSLQSPGSYETVDAVAWKFIPKDVRFQLGERKRLHDREKVEGFRTDSPVDTSTTGQELPAEVKGTLNALQYAKANPDKI